MSSPTFARAKALEMAEGRVLSFLSVEDIPEVRVDIKLYEISRTALLSWNSAQSGTVSDFRRPSTLQKTFVQNPVTGEFVEQPQAPTSNEDVQNIVSFLAGGIANRFQISGNHLEINSLLTLLEREGIARSLSSPQLTVLSGELAFFGVGGTVPIENSVVTQFGSGINNAGSTLGHPEPDRRARLRHPAFRAAAGRGRRDDHPRRDPLDLAAGRRAHAPDPRDDGQTLTTTAFEERSLRTSARLRDGQTLLIGGLMSRTRTDELEPGPGLHQCRWSATSSRATATATRIASS
jgi:Flp pilus assembly secretin CpaC